MILNFQVRDPAICEGMADLACGLKLTSTMVTVKGAEPPMTTKTADFCGVLDYIFSSQPESVLRVLDIPAKSEEDAKTFPPIPDVENFPSDHMALVCDFAVGPVFSYSEPSTPSPKLMKGIYSKNGAEHKDQGQVLRSRSHKKKKRTNSSERDRLNTL